MPQPNLNCADRYASFMPPRGASLAESVQVEVFANRPVLAGDLDLFSLFIAAFGQCGSTLTAVQAGALGNALQLSKEVIVRASFFINENPALMWSLLVPCFKQRN